MHKMLNDMYEKKNNISENVDVQNEFSKEHVQKIESLKNIKHDKPVPNKSTGPEKVEKAPEKIPDKKAPPLPNNSAVNNKKKE
jgi:hypothetical protein